MRRKWKQKLSRPREISIQLSRCWSLRQWKVGKTSRSAWEGGRKHSALEVHYQRKEQTASSSRKFSFRRFMSSSVQKPSEEPLEPWSCVTRNLFPPSSPAWAHGAGARRCSDVSPWFIYLMKNNERDDPQESLEIPLTLQNENIDKLVIILKWTRESERKNACRKGLFNEQRF